MDSFTGNMLLNLIRGNHQAFEQIFNALFKKLYTFSKEYVVDSETAREIAQDAFLKLWETKSQLRDDTNITAYLFTIVRNSSINYLKQKLVKKRFIEYSQVKYQQYLLNYYALADESSEQIIYKELEDKIYEVIKQLPPKCKTIFELSRFQELKHKEIANRLNISEKTVENHIAEALRRIRVQLASYLP